MNDPEAWKARAACRGEDVQMFYTQHFDPRPFQLCAKCPVKPQCLDEAMREHHYGIWAGTSERERRRMRAAQRRAPRDQPNT